MSGGERLTVGDVRDLMLALVKGAEQIFPDCSITLMVAPFDAEMTKANFVTNTDKGELTALLKEIVGRLEGRIHVTPPVVN